MRFMIFLCVFLFSLTAYPLQRAITQPIPINDLQNFNHYPEGVKQLIYAAKKLSQERLTYEFGSDSPRNRGMDCSGLVYFLLNNLGIHDVPRESDLIYLWAKNHGHMHRVYYQTINSPEFWHLKPGDLLFWEGTYSVKRAIPVTHVMIYLGKNKYGQPLMFGSSDGRAYNGHIMWGVSVFDFSLYYGRRARFYGYSCIPHLTC